MLKHVKGNLIDLAEAGQFNMVVHGCNCFCKMGGGIAKEIRQRYPEVAECDEETYCGDYEKLGNYSQCVVNRNGVHFTFVNAYTQFNISTGQDVFEYAAFELILKKLAHDYPTRNFGFPYIGMGLAGGDKTCIMEMLENFATQITKTGGTVTLVEFAS